MRYQNVKILTNSSHSAPGLWTKVSNTTGRCSELVVHCTDTLIVRCNCLSTYRFFFHELLKLLEIKTMTSQRNKNINRSIKKFLQLTSLMQRPACIKSLLRRHTRHFFRHVTWFLVSNVQRNRAKIKGEEILLSESLTTIFLFRMKSSWFNKFSAISILVLLNNRVLSNETLCKS